MQVIIAGSRDGFTYEDVEQAVKDSGFEITHIISGGAKGVDLFAVQYAAKKGILYTILRAEWNRFGKSAGYRRNVEMAEKAEALIALRYNNSKGTTHMINIAKEKGFKIYILDKYDDKPTERLLINYEEKYV